MTLIRQSAGVLWALAIFCLPLPDAAAFGPVHVFVPVEPVLAPGCYDARPLESYRINAASDSDSVVIQPGERLFLEPNRPNPFNTETGTLIAFSLPEPMHVRLAIYDSFYRQIVVLLDEEASAGRNNVLFNPGSLPEGLASGFYFYELTTNTERLVRRMMYVK